MAEKEMQEVIEQITSEEEVSSTEGKQEKEKFDLKGEIISWVKVVLFALVLAWFLASYVLMNAYIPSGSMKNTLHEKDRVLGLRLAYLFDDPERFDVVMFKYPDDESKDYIKRVIGLPGETVTIENGKVYIDDSKVPLNEPYLKDAPLPIGDGVYEVPEDCYFMLGDNRNNSKDSRLWTNKYVKRDKILAKALFRFYPDFTWIETDY